MKTRIISGLALAVVVAAALCSGPSFAKSPSDTPGMVVPEQIRFEYVFEVAKRACPQMNDIVNARKMTDYLTQMQKQLGLSDYELTSLLNHCLLYGTGFTKGQRG